MAARLQTYAHEGSIVIGKATYEIVRDTVEARPLGMAELKGKSTPTTIYELIGLRSAPETVPDFLDATQAKIPRER